MIAKLLLITLLGVEQVLAEATTSAFQTVTLSSPKSSFNWTTTPKSSKESNVSSTFTINHAIPASNVSSSRLQQETRRDDQPQIHAQVKDLGYYPVDRFTATDNTNNFHGHFSIRKDSLESQPQHQPVDKPKGKSKGFIEFEFDIDDEIADGGSNHANISADQEIISYPSTLNRILSSLIPRSMADIFRLSYVAGPQNFKDEPAVPRSRPNKFVENGSQNIIVAQTSGKSSVKRHSLYSPDPLPKPTLSTSSTAPTATENTNTTISGPVTRKDIHDINVAIEIINSTKILPDEIDKSPINPLSQFGEQINLNTWNASDYDDYNLNLGEDNLIAPSQKVSKQLFYPSSPEMQTNLAQGEKYVEIQLPALEKQINVQIIQDNLGGYGQKLPFSPTKQLDDFQEEVEKHFNPNDDRIQSEAASRKFLKKFKETLIRPPPMEPEYQIVVKPKNIQPKSLLHTYIYSSESAKDSALDSYSSDNNSYVATPLESTYKNNGEAQSQPRSKPALPASLLHTYIFSSEFGKDSKSDTYNISDSTLMKDEINNYNAGDAHTSSENQETRERYLNSKLHNNIFHIRGYSNAADNHIYSTKPYPSVRHDKDLVFDGYSTENNSYVASPTGNAYEINEEVQTQPTNQESRLNTYIFSTEFGRNLESDRYNKSDLTQMKDQINNKYEGDAQTSENQQTREISLPHSTVPNNNIFFIQGSLNEADGNLHSTTSYPGDWHDPITQVEIQKSVNIHNKYITEKNGNLIEQHEIYTRPKAEMNVDSPQQFQLLEITTPISLLEHPIRVAQAEEPQQSENAVKSESILQYQNQPDLQQMQPEQLQEEIRNQQQLYNPKYLAEAERPVLYPDTIENKNSQPYQIGRLVEKYIDRPVHVQHIVEKQVNIPYPVREIVEKIVDRPVPVDKIIERPVHIPYPVQIDHFIDRPYAVQFPVAIPVPVHRYIDRPYPVEKIVERPIHIRIPYPVETVVEKIVEKHVPVEVERIVEKPVEKIVEKHVDRPFPLNKIVNHPVPVHIPVPVGVPVAVALTIDKNSKRKAGPHKAGINVNDFLELVPPALPGVDGQGHGYKTLPENIDILLLDESNLPINENQYLHWGQPVKRGTKSRYIKRSPEFAQNFRVEYGFKPPIVPSLEIDNNGLPLESWL